MMMVVRKKEKSTVDVIIRYDQYIDLIKEAAKKSKIN